MSKLNLLNVFSNRSTINQILFRRSLKTKTANNDLLRFDGQTAIITGAGRGLGREYALLLASRGANVVVNDYGGSKSGELDLEGVTKSAAAADQVVDEIKHQNLDNPNSNAIANYESISDEKGVEKLIKQTMNEFGRIDILINNAGILRDRSFAKMTIHDWDQVYNVHLRGSFLLSHACWPIMRLQEYGKIIMTSSTSGLYGNFGQANYAAAKMGLIGLVNCLAIEGKSKNIHCNTIVPMAASRMTKDLIPEELATRLKPAHVAPLVAWLCHQDCKSSGLLVEAAGGWYGRHRLLRARGKYIAQSNKSTSETIPATMESLAKHWEGDICESFDGDVKATRIDSFNDHLGSLMSVFESNK